MPGSHTLVTALRSLLRRPGQSAVAFLVLALGIGLTTAMFAVVDGFLLSQLPFERSDRLVHLERLGAEPGRRTTVGDFLDWRAGQGSFEDLAAFATSSVALSDGERAERYPGARISAHAFGLLRVVPALGRSFADDDDRPGAALVILLGDAVWRGHFGADPAVVGRTVLVEGVPTTVVGVMPPGFAFPLRENVWLPLRPERNAAAGGEVATVDVFGRLRDGVTRERSAIETSLLARQLAAAEDGETAAMQVAVVPYTHAFMGGGGRDLSIRLGLAVGALVLLIACANVANLLLARFAGRRREIALHAALGAGRRHAIARVLAEGLCLALPAGLAGLGLAALGLRLLETSIASAGQRDWPYWIELGLDGRTLLAAAILSL
ncbi:MAG TPA: ABC transporter permease, partial [Thermoanaerobaculia bacterium]|nr:ABC transporter permease [Thermoanaerobaculia bacterium]